MTPVCLCQHRVKKLQDPSVTPSCPFVWNNLTKRIALSAFVRTKANSNTCKSRADQSLVEARAEGYKCEAVTVETSAAGELNATSCHALKGSVL
ncbi:unnamed protein product [Pleuronectes platessa]|uniref:Uncharacterized protein n=1 Tax=Pleuronectes platessa TaxID=8262 RepID=A0A9N7USP8_PLEPL|nr:unnamed protein product [Pleuronectes platessa]